jgi:phage recombination protein Bet
MTTEIATMDDNKLVKILISSVFPGASETSALLALNYCKAANLDVMQKPVHIVPMWDAKAGQMRDVIMPGIGLYRVAASRTGQYLGMSEPEWGPEVTREIGGVSVTFPEWCKVTCYRLVAGHKAEFPAMERWMENYAVRGGKDKSIAPNAMWAKRPWGQLLKCAEAQALRKAFPEVGAQPTAEEMEGRVIEEREVYGTHATVKPEPAALPEYPADKMAEMLPKWQAAIESGRSNAEGIIAMISTKFTLTEDQQQTIHDLDQGEAA